MRYIQWFGVILLVVTDIQEARSDQATANVTVNVAIVAAPCEINNNQNIDVDFGSEVAVTDVAAGLVERNISYVLDCDSTDTGKSLSMMISGTSADFDADVLKTSIADLGVKIKANGSEFPLNTAFNFASAEAKPALTALLVQKVGSRLETGAFSAGATMTVSYQ